MRHRPIPVAVCDRIYDVLVRWAGALEDERENFVGVHTRDIGCTEYRFRGHLGFGGKYRSETWSVDCYPEDRTTERDEIITHTSAALASLREDVGRTLDAGDNP